MPGAASYLKNAGKAVVWLGVAYDAYDIMNAVNLDKGKFGVNTRQTVSSVAGGWGGAIIGASVGTAICPVVGTFIGGVIGGFGGGLIGNWVGRLSF